MVTSSQKRILTWLSQFSPDIENSWDVNRDIALPGIADGLGDVYKRQVIIYSILSERDTNSVIIFLSGLEEKYDLTLSLILVALPTYRTLPCSVLKR